MENYIWLGNTSQIVDSLDSEKQCEEFLKDSRIFMNDEHWIFANKDDVDSLYKDYPNALLVKGTVEDWVSYAACDFRLHSMETIEHDESINYLEFESTVRNKARELSQKDIENVDIEHLTEVTVKELIITHLQKHIEKLKLEIR